MEGGMHRLSRHVLIRPDGDGFVVETSLGRRSLPLVSPSAFRLLLAMVRPVRLADVVEAVPERQRPIVERFLKRCVEDGIVVPVSEDGREDASRIHWEPHDLSFHTRSRRGRNRTVVGGTFHLRDVVEPEPALKPASDRPSLPLPRPDLAAVERRDPPLTRVLEARRSRYGIEPLDLAMLGEFLFRTCRVTHTAETDTIGPYVRKVYPSGGSLHSLETYVVSVRCDGLDHGVHHYRAADHALTPVCGYTDDVEELLQEARVGTGGALPDVPSVLLVITSRFRRVMWKYQSMAYGTILKEVGGLYQTMYLVATTMGLSPTAIGAGDSDRFARVAGTDYYLETSVGEFVLGGPVPGSARL